MTYQLTEIRPEFELSKNIKNLELILVFFGQKKHVSKPNSHDIFESTQQRKQETKISFLLENGVLTSNEYFEKDTDVNLTSF